MPTNPAFRAGAVAAFRRTLQGVNRRTWPGAMMAKHWSDLTTGQRRFIVVAAAAEAALKTAMLIDLKRRPAGQVRGPKWLWASTALLNTAGIAPLSYFIVGRR